MNRLFSIFRIAGLSAGLMYFFDPDNGRRRRAMIRDQAAHIRNQADEAIETGVRDLRNRASGLRSEMAALIINEPASDRVLSERVRSQLGFLTRSHRAIQTEVRDGWLYLSGDVVESEVDRVVKGLAKVRGIKGVENRLTIYEDASQSQDLQKVKMRETMQAGMWSPSTRLLAGMGSLYLLLRGRKGGLMGFLYNTGGFLLGLRAVTNQGPRQFLGLTEEAETISVTKSINIHAPVDEVYALWSNFETFPQFMAHVQEIQTTGDGSSHWVVTGPAGSSVEFTTVVVEDIPNEIIIWQTVPGSPVRHRGRVRFQQTGPDQTRVDVRMSYTPPAGAIGHAVASLFGVDPKQAMDEDLVRLKSLLEVGKTTLEGQTIRQEDLNSI